MNEVFLSPTSTADTYVVSGMMTSYGPLGEGRELRFGIGSGYVTEIPDDDVREQVEVMAEEVGDGTYSLAEIGIGTSVGVIGLVGSVLLDGKAAGTVHVTVGDDAGIDGNTDMPLHFDGIIHEPAVYTNSEEVNLS